MLTPEGRVKKQLRAVLDELGVYYFMPATGGYGRSGVPDIVGCARHQFFAIECKAKGGKLTALQHREINKIIMEGGRAFVYDGTMTPEEVKERIGL
jgi:Holliday junction resolvase